MTDSQKTQLTLKWMTAGYSFRESTETVQWLIDNNYSFEGVIDALAEMQD